MGLNDFSTGQRWSSDSEPDLGLGIVVDAANRRVRIFFPDTGVDRTYTMNEAPLSRVVFDVGDDVVFGDRQEGRVSGVSLSGGLANYQITADDEVFEVPETQILSGSSQFPALDRLVRGRWDRASWYRMRREITNHRPLIDGSEVRGLIGPRVSLVPHQFYIAHSLSNRHAPRVLLSDEVGLGKTIEAGLIIHQHLVTGRASRVLVLVPDSLVHQWLVEMKRRFALAMSIVTQDALDDDQVNAFEEEQLFICPTSLLTSDASYLQHALSVDWDLVVVDEAHHIEWHVDEASWEYSCLEQLSQAAKGLLLLTATPEQMGAESHFGRLRLLDPARYDDFDAWQAEESQFKAVNDALEQISKHRDDYDIGPIEALLSDDELIDLKSKHGEERAKWLEEVLLDRHGTGRVVYRNTRRVIADLLPGRSMESHALPHPVEDYDWPSEGDAGLYPEVVLGDGWVERDPRAHWLVEFLKRHKNDKVLVIAHYRETVEALESWLTLRHGIRAAAFHEGMNLVNRDRAAAWFADQEMGAQVLLCSEIGSEGRNFQFSSNLVLFDLPRHPDLLEQRIGRLDRIGQQNRVQIHAPYIEGTAQESLLKIYDDAFSAFVGASLANGAVFQDNMALVQECLNEPTLDHAPLIQHLSTQVQEARKVLSEGRDRLLERSSFNEHYAAHTLELVEAFDDDPWLELWLLNALDRFGIESEEMSERVILIRPTGHRMVEQLSTLPVEGFSATFDREVALAREDVEWLTWEHPFVMEYLELFGSGEYGTANAAIVKTPELDPGTVLLECVFSPLVVAPKALQVARYCELKPLRVVLKNGAVWDNPVSSELIDETRLKIERKPVQSVVEKLAPKLKPMVRVAAEFAHADFMGDYVDAAYDAEDRFDAEIERLQSLRLRNPSIRSDEIDALMRQKAGVIKALKSVNARLDSIRLVLAT
ncbi:MAG: RNA polymerase-associated protein RapA [Gammaproteobacteria bacterium]|nr:RNA polymerase-associated protein RapA [Gammaproteobacteria bacterium]